MSATAPSTLRKVMTWLAPVLIVVIAVVLIVLAQRDGGAASSPAATSPPVEVGEGEAGAPAGEDDAAAQPPADAAGQAEEAAEHRIDDDKARRDADDPLGVGELDAPVALIVYSDYQCPFCAKWADETQTVLMDEYVEDGDLRIEWRDVNIFGPESKQGAKAAYAAGLQGKFQTFHEALFKGGDILPKNEMSPDALTDLALSLALDADQFRIDMDSQETADAIEENEEEGIALGAFSTPSFLINGIPLAGAQPTDVFTTLIDNELAAKK